MLEYVKIALRITLFDDTQDEFLESLIQSGIQDLLSSTDVDPALLTDAESAPVLLKTLITLFVGSMWFTDPTATEYKKKYDALKSQVSMSSDFIKEE